MASIFLPRCSASRTGWGTSPYRIESDPLVFQERIQLAFNTRQRAQALLQRTDA